MTPELVPQSPLHLHSDHQLTGAARGSLSDNITQRAGTDKGTLCVLTESVEADVRVQVILVHICGMMGEEAGEHGGVASALLSALPHRYPLSISRDGELPPAPPSGSCECYLNDLQSTADMHFQKGFYGQIHLKNTELNKANQICYCRPFQSLYANVDLQDRYEVGSIP